MSSSKKLFVAAILLAAGYGAAALWGAPDPRKWSESCFSSRPISTTPAADAPRVAEMPTGLGAVGSVRLLPEPQPDLGNSVPTSGQNGAATPVPQTRPLAAGPALVAEAPPAPNSAPAEFSARSTRLAPRATLRNEAPRPLLIEPRPPAVGPVETESGLPQVAPPPESFYDNARVSPAAYASEIVAANPPAETSLQPIWPPVVVSAPVWPAEEAAPLRTHLIVDGDSLAKLAGRYLGDPRRSDEILVLNRGVLSDPDLLPIGAELKIPPRTPTADSSQPSQARRRSSLHAAEHTGLVPVNYLPSASPQVMPRAQLLPPRPVN